MKRKIRKLSNAEIMAQAMMIARRIVKDELKRQEVKISWVDAEQITKAAKHLIEHEPKIIKAAKAEIRHQDRMVRRSK